jgi:protein-S-isoprenylcysteine O-methyltransferase Ste14
MAPTLLFAVVSLFFVWFSRSSLRVPGAHGFYRFFAWECMAALFLLNAPVWFRDPFSLAQIASWLLLTGAAALAIHGIQLLREMGRPDANRADAGLVGFEKTTRLVTRGAYRYIRRPLYSSLLMLDWGIFLKDPSWLGLGLALAATLFLTATARAEEAENLRFFGAAYHEYMKHTSRFLPHLF